MAVATKKAMRSGEPVNTDKLEDEKGGRPSLLSDEVTADIKRFITLL